MNGLVHSDAEGVSVPTEKADKPAGPDLATLWRDDRKGQFTVVIQVRATVRETICAADADEARSLIANKIENDGFDLMPDDLDEAAVVSVRPDPPMYLVLRDGKEWSVSHPKPGDQPREPNCAYETAKYTVPPSATPAEAPA